MRINLLPPKVETELFEEEIKKLIIILGILILFFFIFLSLLLFTTKTYISGQLISYKTLVDSEKKQLQVSEIQNLKKEIKLVNKNLSQLESFYEGEVNLTEVFDKISVLFPPEMYLTNFSYQRETAKVLLSGFAPTRASLLEFKKDLEKEFPNLYFPPQNWIKSIDIDFQLSFTLP